MDGESRVCVRVREERKKADLISVSVGTTSINTRPLIRWAPPGLRLESHRKPCMRFPTRRALSNPMVPSWLPRDRGRMFLAHATEHQVRSRWAINYKKTRGIG
jgi:hypothetical protein